MVSDILNNPTWQGIKAVRDGKVFQLLSRQNSTLGGCLDVAWIVNKIYADRYSNEQRSADGKKFYTYTYKYYNE